MPGIARNVPDPSRARVYPHERQTMISLSDAIPSRARSRHASGIRLEIQSEANGAKIAGMTMAPFRSHPALYMRTAANSAAAQTITFSRLVTLAYERRNTARRQLGHSAYR